MIIMEAGGWKVGDKFTDFKGIGPSEESPTSGANLGRPLILVVIFYSFLSLHPVPKIPEGVVVGFQNFALAPTSQKYEDSNKQKTLCCPWSL